METRAIHELLQLTLNNFDKYFEFGLCSLISRMCYYGIINNEEFEILSKYLHNNLPPNQNNWLYPNYIWMPAEKEPRLRWLIEQIEKTK